MPNRGNGFPKRWRSCRLALAWFGPCRRPPPAFPSFEGLSIQLSPGRPIWVGSQGELVSDKTKKTEPFSIGLGSFSGRVPLHLSSNILVRIFATYFLGGLDEPSSALAAGGCPVVYRRVGMGQLRRRRDDRYHHGQYNEQQQQRNGLPSAQCAMRNRLRRCCHR